METITKSPAVINSITAGILGALGGVVTKIGFDKELIITKCRGFLHYDHSLLCSQFEVVWVAQAFFIFLMLAFNTLMFRFFNLALQSSDTSTEASLMTTAINIFASGMLGYALFGEALSAKWLLGSMCIVMGMVLIGADKEVKQGSSKKEN